MSRNASPVEVAAAVRSEVRDARLVKPIAFDGGSLQLDVAHTSPRVDEAHAVALFRAGSPPTTTVGNVTVVYAEATLRLPVDTAGIVIRPRVVPKFDHRAAWVFIWARGAENCNEEPATSPTTVAPVEARQVELVAADASGEGVSYTTRGSVCSGAIVGPHAEVASYYVSLPWSPAGRSTSSPALRFGAVPPCGGIEMTPTSRNLTSATFGVYADVLMARAPCTGSPQRTSTPRPVALDVVLLHDPTGLAAGRFTNSNMTRFTYFDGRSHTTI